MGNKLVFNGNPDVEFDSNYNAWNYYRYKYKDNFEIKEDGKKHFANIRIDDKVTITNVKINGECVYNFGSKYNALKKIIGDDIQNGELLEKCRVMHHSLPNIMLLPQNGGLNNLKGKIYYTDKSGWRIRKVGGKNPIEWFDRPDSLICYMSDFYEKYGDVSKLLTLEEAGEFFSNGIFTESVSRGENFRSLYDLLIKMRNVENFCNIFYQIDPILRTKMCKVGRKPIRENVFEYLNEAIGYWKSQINKLGVIVEKEKLTLIVYGKIAKEMCEEVGFYVISEDSGTYKMKPEQKQKWEMISKYGEK